MKILSCVIDRTFICLGIGRIFKPISHISLLLSPDEIPPETKLLVKMQMKTLLLQPPCLPLPWFLSKNENSVLRSFENEMCVFMFCFQAEINYPSFLYTPGYHLLLCFTSPSPSLLISNQSLLFQTWGLESNEIFFEFFFGWAGYEEMYFKWGIKWTNFQNSRIF